MGQIRIAIIIKDGKGIVRDKADHATPQDLVAAIAALTKLAFQKTEQLGASVNG